MFLSHGPFIPQLTDNSRLWEHHLPGDAIGVGCEESHSGRFSGVLALGPCLREDNGQGNRALLSAHKRTARLDDGKSC